MNKESGKTGALTAILTPVLENYGVELVDLVYRKEGKEWVLRLFIDKAGGVSLDDCSFVSREVGDLLDSVDVVEHGYNLEVSSPGLNRILKKESDFIRFTGRLARVKTFEAVDGSRNFKGVIAGFENAELTLDVSGVAHRIPHNLICNANLEFEFKNEKC